METTDNRIPQGRRQNPLTFYLRTLLYMFMALVMRIVALLPLGALWVFPEGSYFRWLAVLCPILLIFFILPLRFSFAQAVVQPVRERRFSFDKAAGLQSYGPKLGHSLLHALHIVLWGIPLGLMLAAGYYFYAKTDAITLMNGITAVGAGVASVLYAIANFFIGIFGGTQLVPNGGLMEGVYTAGAVLCLGVLILLWGMLRNSAYRYIWALSTRLELDPRTELHRRLRGHRWAQLGTGLINLVLWVPALFVVATTLKGVLSDFSNSLFTYIATKQFNLPELSTALWPLLFAFLVCYMPLLPVRRLITAYFATRKIRHGVQTEVTAAEPVVATAAEVAAPLVAAPVAAAAVATATTEAVAAPVVATQVYAPITEPVQEEEAEEPTPTPMPVPAYEPYHAAEPAPVKAPEPQYQPEPVAEAPVMEPETVEPTVEAAPIAAPEAPAPVAAEPEPVFQPYQEYQPYQSYQPVETMPVKEAEAEAEPAGEPEEPLAEEQEDFFAQPFHAAEAVEEEAVAQDEPSEKPAAPLATDGDAETEK